MTISDNSYGENVDLYYNSNSKGDDFVMNRGQQYQPQGGNAQGKVEMLVEFCMQ
jgi:hypothetical protein